MSLQATNCQVKCQVAVRKCQVCQVVSDREKGGGDKKLSRMKGIFLFFFTFQLLIHLLLSALLLALPGFSSSPYLTPDTSDTYASGRQSFLSDTCILNVEGEYAPLT